MRVLVPDAKDLKGERPSGVMVTDNLYMPEANIVKAFGPHNFEGKNYLNGSWGWLLEVGNDTVLIISENVEDKWCMMIYSQQGRNQKTGEIISSIFNNQDIPF